MKKMAIVIVLLFSCGLTFAADIYVSTAGSDRNAGTKSSPLATLPMALRKARELRRLNDPGIAGGITIFVGKGTYRLHEPVVLRPEDSGTPSSPTIVKAAGAEQPVLSGGIPVYGWHKLTGTVPYLPKAALGHLWVADAPAIAGRALDLRQLWVNERKALRAQSTGREKMDRIVSWDHVSETCEIPLPQPDFRYEPGMELFIQQWWAIAILRVKSAIVTGKVAKLSFEQPESRVQSEHPWPAPWLSKQTGNSAFRLTNALQFLDSPGEWYLDARHGKLYYWPLPGENMAAAEVIAPYLETLVRIEGTADRPVINVKFNNIAFCYSTWLLPSQQGLVPHQNGMYMLDAYKLAVPGTPDKAALENQAWVGRPAAAVEARFTENTGFENCRFEHLASTGLDYARGNAGDQVSGNLFRDIGGSGILAGVYSDPQQEVHVPYHPKDERDVSRNVKINDNLVTDVSNEDWGCVGIGAGYVKDISIDHNDVSDVAYSAITLGWGWTKSPNAMSGNRVTGNRIRRYGKYLYDVAGIYTLSAQPGTLIAENDVDSICKAPYPHDPNHWFYLYTDEGSSYITVKDNWTPAEKYLQNANGPGNIWTNNGPWVSDAIREAAGIRQPYRRLLTARRRPSTQAINHTERTTIVEATMPEGQSPDRQLLTAIGKRTGLNDGGFYVWKNHAVFYGAVENPRALRAELVDKFPGANVKIYGNLVYEFNRAKNCPGATIAKEWDHVLLTANLVADTALQNEYVNYHARQFTDWPEVSRGFCNADFQQLLVFRNGRQLMLVISIPKGESLEKLNPKTTENNPRVDDWNNLMKKYQEGIAGTAAGETWVFLERLNLN